MTRMLYLVLSLSCAVPLAKAGQYWVDYGASSAEFPEQQGWSHFTGYGGAQRWFENSALVVDTRADPRIYDYYQRRLNGALDPDPGELFLMQWRMKVDAVTSGLYKTSIGVFSDEKWAVGFHLSETGIVSAFEQGVHASFSPGVPHDFELWSGDMRSYQLTIDGSPAIQGSFWLSLTASEVAWGDDGIGATGLTHWDYVRFGVVPEPATCWLGVIGLALAHRRASNTRR